MLARNIQWCCLHRLLVIFIVQMCCVGGALSTLRDFGSLVKSTPGSLCEECEALFSSGQVQVFGCVGNNVFCQQYGRHHAQDAELFFPQM